MLSQEAFWSQHSVFLFPMCVGKMLKFSFIMTRSTIFLSTCTATPNLAEDRFSIVRNMVDFLGWRKCPVFDCLDCTGVLH